MIGWWLNRRAVRMSEDELSVWCELDPEGWTAGSVVAARLRGRGVPPKRTYAALQRIEARGWATTPDAGPIPARVYRAVVSR